MVSTQNPVPVPVSVSVDDPCPKQPLRPRAQIHASARLFVAKALRTPPARKLVALFDFLSSNSRLTHSSSLKPSSADRCETHETEVSITAPVLPEHLISPVSRAPPKRMTGSLALILLADLSRQINIPSTYVDIWRSWHPPKPSRPATPSQNWIIIQRQRQQQN